MEPGQRLPRVLRAYGPALLLLLILLAAAGFRFYGLDWDSEMGAYPHPDERHLANTMSHVSLPWPPNWSNLADPDVSTLNPRRVNPEDPQGAHYDLAYGTLPVYLYRGVTSLFIKSRPYDSFYMVGRTITALLSLLTLFLVYLIGKDLFGRRVGLLASAFLAVAVTHIQLSHFMTVDVALAAFATAALYMGVQLVRKRGWWRALLLGVLVGCGMACKVSGLTLGAVILGAGILIALLPGERGERTSIAHVIRYMALAGLGVVLAFGLFEFYALLNPATYLETIGKQAEMVSGEIDWPFTRQYINTAPYLYHLENLARWGLGWPLMVTAALGVLSAAGYLVYVAIRRPGHEPGSSWGGGLGQSLWADSSRWGLFLLLFWAIPYFALVGGYVVKFVRYMVPLAPALCLVAAWFLVALAGWLGRRARALPDTNWGRDWLPRLGAGWTTDGNALGRVAYGLVIAAVLVPTILWAFAFSRIYARPHTWYQASLWLYENAPDGSVISEEVWDDSLPVSLPAENENRGKHGFGHVSMNPYHDMPPEQKLQHIAGVLEQADYIALATPRLYSAVRQLPWRYPMEIRYYELLFQEELGFELAYTATSYPSLWGKAFVDDEADESFSVYDHPKVLIYEKTRQLSEADYRRLFDDALKSTSMIRRDLPDPPAELPVPEYQKPLMLGSPVDELPAVRDWAWNGIANSGTLPATLFWLLALLLVGLAAYPLTAALFPTFPARGAMLARTLGLMLIAYLTWLPVSLGLWHYTAWAVAGGLALVALISWGVTRWRGIDLREIWRTQRKSILTAEAVFLACFLLFLLIRIWNPDLWHPARGGEKPMEIGFLNAILRSPTMPPYDPFFSDGYINYYYYGLFIVSTLIKLTGIRSSMAFNLIIPTLAVMTISGAFAIVWTLTGRRLYGLAAGLFTALIGNLAGAGQIRGRGGLGEAVGAIGQLANPDSRGTLAGTFQGLFRWLGGQKLPLRTDWFWDASRAHGPYENTITEFPFFSFLFADLHPHLIGLPFAILLIGFCLSLVRAARRPAGEGAPLLLTLPALALGLGTMAVNNSWDFPVYLLVVGGAVLLAHRVHPREGEQLPPVWRSLLAGSLGAGLLGILGLLLYAPFFTYFKAFVRGLGMTTYPTEIKYYLGVFGFFLFPLATLLLGWAGVWGYRAWQRAREPAANGVEEVSIDRPAALPADLFLGAGSLYLEEDFDEYDDLDELGSPSPSPTPPTRAQSVRSRIPRVRLSWLQPNEALVVLIALLIPLVSALILPALYDSLNGRQMLTFVLLGELTLGVILMLLRENLSDELRFAALLSLVGLLVSLGVEIVYVKDHLSGAWYRMNTIFKFYIQVWVLFGISSAVLLWAVARRLRRRHKAISIVWWSAFGLLLAAVLVYPLFGTYTRVNDRFPQPPPRGTIDGQAYMLTADYVWEGHPVSLEPDYHAMHWLEENLQGTPIVLQAAWEFYRANGVRIAWNTGYPTVLNPLHEDEQRYPGQKGERERDVSSIFNEPDPAEVLPLLSKYHVDYIYVGPFERAAYSPGGIAKFDAMVDVASDVVYNENEVKIYRVKEDALAGGGQISAPMVVPTVSPQQTEKQAESELERLRVIADANPADAGLQFDLGNRLRHAGRYEEAVEVFQRSLKFHPEDVAMYQTLGDTYRDMGRMNDALEQYRAAVDAAPDNPAVYNKLGMDLLGRERYDEAIEVFQEAIRVDPSFAEAYFHLGETLERAGKSKEAGDVYQQLIELASDSDWAAKARERLRGLTAG